MDRMRHVQHAGEKGDQQVTCNKKQKIKEEDTYEYVQQRIRYMKPKRVQAPKKIIKHKSNSLNRPVKLSGTLSREICQIMQKDSRDIFKTLYS
jgi:hypothetical protein